VDEILTRLIEAGTVRPLIVVGIDPGQRDREFLPYKDTVFSPSSPEPAGKEFPNFLANEVVPLIAGRYRIEKGPQGIGGASYGAIAALYALLARPDLFNLGLLESPSLAVGNGQLLRDTEHLFEGPSCVYLGMGGMESGGSPDSPENLGYIAMVHILEQNLKGTLVNPPAVLTVIQPEGKHRPASWASRFERAIEFLYPAAKQEPAPDRSLRRR
jgi:predicted alpha/beta superfamily hydrolase